MECPHTSGVAASTAMPRTVACFEPFDPTFRQEAGGARGVLVSHIALEEVRQGGNARVRMQAETAQRL